MCHRVPWKAVPPVRVPGNYKEQKTILTLGQMKALFPIRNYIFDSRKSECHNIFFLNHAFSGNAERNSQ
jgi:hypothetical protein